MVSVEYRGMIRSLCELAGLGAWEEVCEQGEIVVDGTGVALVHDEVESPGFLSLYFDLCAMPPDDALPRRLLEHAMTSDAPEGRFGCLPMGDRLIYRAEVACDPVPTADSLLSSIHFHLEAARRGLAACGAPA